MPQRRLALCYTRAWPIHSCATEKNRAGAKAIVEAVKSSGSQLNNFVYKTLLDACVECYALHRYFVHMRGWFINGMSQDSSGWNSSSMTNPMHEREPAHVQDLLELHLVSRGSNLQELAALTQVLLN